MKPPWPEVCIGLRLSPCPLPSQVFVYFGGEKDTKVCLTQKARKWTVWRGLKELSRTDGVGVLSIRLGRMQGVLNGQK